MSVSADQEWRRAAINEMNGKAKPPGSLGMLEAWAIKLAVIQTTLQPQILDAYLLIFAADHGVTISHPRVSAYPRQVSSAVFYGIASGGAASAVLCKANDCKLDLIDVGLDADVCTALPSPELCHSITHAKVRREGSRDMTKGPAITFDECMDAQSRGRRAVINAIKDSISTHEDQGKTKQEIQSKTVICVGELGIGNSTSASALVAALTGQDPSSICGRGTGLSNQEDLDYKCNVIQSALEVNADLISTQGPIGILQAVGGLEIAAMVGAYLQAYDLGVPVMVDGFISGAAALVALNINPEVDRVLFWSHRSNEKGCHRLLHAAAVVASQMEGEGGEGGEGLTTVEETTPPSSSSSSSTSSSSCSSSSSSSSSSSDQFPLKCHAPLDMGLRLGEGTGAVLALPLLRSAAAIMSNMVALKDLVR